MLAIIGGDPKRFLPNIDLHFRAYQTLEKPPQPIGMHSPGYVAATDEKAREEFWPAYKVMRDRVGMDRGWPPIQRAEFDRETAHGSLYVGSPQTVARRIAETVKALGVARFDLKYSAGPLSHQNMMRCIELYGTEVVPVVREMINHDGDA
jgi:alkanesulfonate monooxygenase SsuD/methylene tetrahydromethanopterin reductase-like flavin-dependent oxidoreductase (luciferase family)